MIDPKINILFIIPSLRIGGAERQVIDLVNGLSEERFNIHLFTFEKQLDLFDGLRKEKIAFYNYPRQHKYDFSPTKKIAQIIDRENIDIIHSTLQIALLFGFLGKTRAKKKVKFISALHTTININFKGELFDWFLYAPLMFFCHRIITVCENQKIHWSKKYPLLRKKFVTIHNGIDMEKFKDVLSAEEKRELKKILGIHDDEFIAAIIAGLRPKKGHEYAFEVLRSLGEAGKKWKFLIIGDGERKNYLQCLSHKLSVAENLVWLGFQKDPRKYLSVSDVLLVPSVAESFPMAILESLSMGKPVIASRVGGNSEVVQDGFNGFLAEPKDIHSFVDKLRIIMTDKSLKMELSKNARESVMNQFSLREMVKKTSGLFEKLALLNE